MKRISKIVAILAVIIGLGASFVPATVGAVNVFDACDSNSDSKVCASDGDKVQALFKTIVDVMIYLIGIVSVIVVIISGFIYTTSNGEPAQVKKAKDTLTYAVAGLVIAIMAYAIVNWVIKWVV